MGNSQSKSSTKEPSRTAKFLQEEGIPLSTTPRFVDNAVSSRAVANPYVDIDSIISPQQIAPILSLEPSRKFSIDSPSSLDLPAVAAQKPKTSPLAGLSRRLVKSVRSPPKGEFVAIGNIHEFSNGRDLRSRLQRSRTSSIASDSKAFYLEANSVSIPNLAQSNTTISSRWHASDSNSPLPTTIDQKSSSPAPPAQTLPRLSRASTISNPLTLPFRTQSITSSQYHSAYESPSSSTSYYSLSDSLSDTSPLSSPLQRRHTLMPVRKPVASVTQTFEALDRSLAEKLQLNEYSSDSVPSDNNPFRRRSVSSAIQYTESKVSKWEKNYWDDHEIPSAERDELLPLNLQFQSEGPSSLHSTKGKQREDSDYALALQIQLDLIEEESEIIVRECSVCGDDVPAADLPALMNCIHEPQTCASCYAGWIASELESKGWKLISCPESSCKQLLEHGDVQRYSSPEVFLRFDALSAREALGDDPNFRWCRAPSCKSGQIHLGGKDDPIFTCISCGHKVCVVHENTFHEGETCEEYEYRSSGKQSRDQAAQEKASRATVEKLTKKCPGRGCSYNIEKIDGCDHMTCSRCRYEFCWLCLADYNAIRKIGNKAHNKGCTYHR